MRRRAAPVLAAALPGGGLRDPQQAAAPGDVMVSTRGAGRARRSSA